MPFWKHNFKCFNSILVRLKVDQLRKSIQQKGRFNSILVRLKAFTDFQIKMVVVDVSIPFWCD